MSGQSDHSENGGADGAPPPETWGIYVYFAADIPNPLMQDAVWETLNTLASVGSNDKVKMTAMIDLPNRDTEYYIFPARPENADKWTVLPDRFLSNVNSARIETILDFLDWSQRNCPAEKVALVFWGHGYALDDFNPCKQGVKANLHGRTSDQGRSADGFPGESGNELKLLYDSTYNSVLNNFEFAKAIREYSVKYHGGKRVEVLGLDCCNMAMVEVLSELQDTVEYAVAAETSTPFQSWLTKQGLGKFVDTRTRSARDFALDAVRKAVDEMAESNPEMYIELAACHLIAFPKLEQAVKALVDALLPAIETYENRRAIAQAWECDVSYLADGLIDLASFCELLQKAIPANGCLERAVIDAANTVIDAVKGTALPLPDDGSEGGVVEFRKFAPNRRDENISLSTGLTIWFPPWIQFPHVYYYQMKQSMDYLFDGYSNTRFAKATGWDRFLRALYRLTQT